MSLQIASPYIRVEDANGLPYVGAQLYIYQPGTTTLAPVYTDDGLSNAAANPATSNAKGEFPRIYIAAGTYKLRAEQSNGALIFEEDDIDTGLSAGTGALPISRGGTGATTASAARANLDVPSNSELSSVSSQVAALQSALSTLSAVPQGRLTLTSGVPVLASGVTAAAAVYYTPTLGNQIPIWNGSSIVITTFTELTLTLNSNHSANNIYDLFVINDAGTLRLVSGPAWSTATAGAGARGTGAGTTELNRTVGILTNAAAMTARYGATTVSVNANCATYVGSMWMDGTNGQVTCHTAYGQARKWGLWNAYNRAPITLRAGDPTTSWATSASGWAIANGDTNNKLTVFQGLAEEVVFARLSQRATHETNTGSFFIGIGVNSTSAPSGFVPTGFNVSGSGLGSAWSLAAFHAEQPTIGISAFSALQNTDGTAQTRFYGTETNMVLNAMWRG